MSSAIFCAELKRAFPAEPVTAVPPSACQLYLPPSLGPDPILYCPALNPGVGAKRLGKLRKPITKSLTLPCLVLFHEHEHESVRSIRTVSFFTRYPEAHLISLLRYFPRCHLLGHQRDVLSTPRPCLFFHPGGTRHPEQNNARVSDRA